MKEVTYVQGLPYGRPGDMVEVEVGDNAVRFIHLSATEASRRGRPHRGQMNSWVCALAAKDILSLKVSNISPGAVLSFLFGWMAGSRDTKSEQKRLVIRAEYGGRITVVMVQGDGADIDTMAAKMTSVQEVTMQLRRRREMDTPILWRD